MNQREYRVSAYGIEFVPYTTEYEAPAEDEVDLCRWFISELGAPKLKRIRRGNSSYGWKHAVERWLRATKSRAAYVSNGAFIQAALDLGFEISVSDQSPNAWFNFNVTRKARETLRELDQRRAQI